MELGRQGGLPLRRSGISSVSILLLMELGRQETIPRTFHPAQTVSILLLMELGRQGFRPGPQGVGPFCFNPSSHGTRPSGPLPFVLTIHYSGFNPSSHGTRPSGFQDIVLLLVLQ